MMKKKLRFGCIGFGFMGKTHTANIIKNPNAELKAIFTEPDIDFDGIRSSNAELKDVDIITDDWKKMIDREDIDAIIIATPTDTHAEIAIYASNSGKHIFLEKPMARTVEETNEIINAAEKNGVKLFIAHVLRFFQAYSSARNSILDAQNGIGNIKMIRGLRYSQMPGWSKWFFDERKSGGCILDLSIHDIDYAMWLIGETPLEVYCEARKLPEKDVNTWTMSMTTLKFKSAIAHLEASWLATPALSWFTENEIIGEKGIIKFDSKSGIPLHIYSDEDYEPVDPFFNDGYYYEMESFINSVLENKSIEVPGEDGRLAVAVCIAAIISAEEGRSVSIEEVLI